MSKIISKINNKIKSVYYRKKYNLKSAWSSEIVKNTFEQDKRNKWVSKKQIKKIHKAGFFVEDWLLCELDDKDSTKYLNNIDYNNLHPINGRFTSWIDDKLTLKYLFEGDEVLKNAMPEYYFYINEKGKFFPLLNFKNADKITTNSMIELLKEKNILACKKLADSLGNGFYKLAYEKLDNNDLFYVNENKYELDDFLDFINNLRGYLITEFIKPNDYIAKFNKNTSNTIRYLCGLDNENNLIFINGYVRFGTKNTGFVDNYAKGGVLCYIDNSGNFTGGNVLDFKTHRNIKIDKFPDNDLELTGKLPEFEKVKVLSQRIFKHFPFFKYLGIDFVYTDKCEYKILEINSLNSLDALQFKMSIFETDAGYFYKEMLNLK